MDSSNTNKNCNNEIQYGLTQLSLNKKDEIETIFQEVCELTNKLNDIKNKLQELMKYDHIKHSQKARLIKVADKNVHENFSINIKNELEENKQKILAILSDALHQISKINLLKDEIEKKDLHQNQFASTSNISVNENKVNLNKNEISNSNVQDIETDDSENDESLVDELAIDDEQYKNFSYDFRKGTDGVHGTDYEKQFLTYLAVKCLLKNFSDYWICGNVDGLDAFDDILLYTEKENGQKDLYFFQLKHKINNKKFSDKDMIEYLKSFQTVQNLLIPYNMTLAEKTKKLLLETEIDFKNMHFIFYTNNLIGKNVIELSASAAKNISFINTSNSENCVLKLDRSKIKNLNVQFATQFFMFSNQASIRDEQLLKILIDCINKLNTSYCNIDILKLVDEVSNWLCSKQLVLCKSRLKTILAEMGISNTFLSNTTLNISRFNKWKTFLTLPRKEAILSENALNLLQDLRLKFQGKMISLISFLNINNSFVDAFKFEDILKVLNGTLVINDIPSQKPVIPKYFVDRTLPKIYLDSTVVNIKNDLFFIIDPTSDFSTFCKPPNYIGYDKNSLKIVKNSNDVCNILNLSNYDKNFHILNVDKNVRANNVIQWIYSETNSVEMLKSRISSEKLEDSVIENFLNYLTMPSVNKYFICADPGMGKTFYLKHLANECPIKYWAVFVLLNELDFSVINNLDAFIKYYETKLNALEQTIFKGFYDNKKVIYLMDGFDEVAPYFVQESLDIIKQSAELGFKTIVSSRKSTVNILTDSLQILPYNLRPFSEDNKKQFLLKYYCQELNLNCNRIEEFVENLLFKIKFSKWDETFTGIPLQLKMMSECFVYECRTFCQEGKIYLPNSLNLLQLYLKFIESKFLLYITEKKNLNPVRHRAEIENWKKYYENNHSEAAMQIIFPEVNIKMSTEFMEEIQSAKEKFGVIIGLNQLNQAIFIHRTFAELFSAKWIYNMLFSGNEFEENIKNDILQYLNESRYSVVKDLLERYTCRSCELHTAILNMDVQKVSDCLSKTKIDPMECGRSALHLICDRGSVHEYITENTNDENREYWKREKAEEFEEIFNYVLQNCQNMDNQPDKITFLTPEEQANKRNAFGIIDILLKYRIIANSNKVLMFVNNNEKGKQLEQLLKMCLRFEYLYILEDILKQSSSEKILCMFIGYGSVFALHLLQYAANEGYCSALPTILNYVDINHIDGEGESALYWACATNNVQSVKILLENNAKIFNGETCPIYRARDNNELLQLLTSFNILTQEIPKQLYNDILPGECKYKTYNIGKGTLLHWACISENIDTIYNLLRQKVNVNVQNECGATALHWSILMKREKSVEMLLKSGADFLLTINFEHYYKDITPYQLALGKSRENIKKLLEQQYEQKLISIPSNDVATNLKTKLLDEET